MKQQLLIILQITPVVLRGISTAGVNLGIALGQLISNGSSKDLAVVQIDGHTEVPLRSNSSSLPFWQPAYCLPPSRHGG